jgi:hypothetical protein
MSLGENFGRALPALSLLCFALALPATASADCFDTPGGPGCATVTIVPPAMGGTPQGSTPRFVYGQVTANPEPSFGVEVNGWQTGDTLVCGIGEALGDLGPCGPPLSGCSAQVCASYRPPAPLSGTGEQSVHPFTAEVRDPSGYYAGSAEFEFAVDATPPATVLGDGPSDSIWRPSFGFSADDDSAYESDTLQCSLVPLGQAPHWRACADEDQGSWAQALPHKRADYQFEARAVDVLGRPDPTPATVDFNPIPCQVRARQVSIAQLVKRGLPVTLDCHFAHRVDVYVDAAACAPYSCVGVKHVTGSANRIWKLSARWRVQPRYVPALKAGRPLRIDVIAEPYDYGEASLQRLALHR